MATEYDYQNECDNIDEFNREEAKRKKAEIAFAAHNAEKASPCIKTTNNHQGVNYHESEVNGNQPLPGADSVQEASS